MDFYSFITGGGDGPNGPGDREFDRAFEVAKDAMEEGRQAILKKVHAEYPKAMTGEQHQAMYAAMAMFMAVGMLREWIKSGIAVIGEDKDSPVKKAWDHVERVFSMSDEERAREAARIRRERGDG